MSDSILFLSLIVFGVVSEILLVKILTKNRDRKIDQKSAIMRYSYLLIFPLLSMVLMFYKRGTEIIYAFLLFSVIGTFFEFFIGYSYQKIVGERLWTYHRFTILKHTSFFSIPLWGLCGVLFWLFARGY